MLFCYLGGKGDFMSEHKTVTEKKAIVHQFIKGDSVVSLCTRYNISKSTLYSWIKQFREHRTGYGVATPKDLDNARKRIKKLEDMVTILQASTQISSMTVKEKEEAVDALYGKYSVRTLCEAFSLPTGTFYNFKLRSKGRDAWFNKRRNVLRDEVMKVFNESNHTYGIRRVQAALQRKGIRTSKRVVAELMREMNITGSREETKAIHCKLGREEKRINLLKQHFDVSSPNSVWVSDMTSIDVKNRRIHICAFLDLFSRKIVAIRCGYSSSSNLALAAIRDAITREHPAPGLVIHTDNGSAFTSYSMRRLAGHYKFRQSFSCPGIPQDNSAMESFFHTLKQECLYRHEFRSEGEFKRILFQYIDYYNSKRIHEYLQYRTPSETYSDHVLEFHSA